MGLRTKENPITLQPVRGTPQGRHEENTEHETCQSLFDLGPMCRS